jgi:uncharacterized membrane protein
VYAGISAVLFLLTWYAVNVLFTIFAGILFAIFLSGLADLLAGHTRLTRGWALAVVIVGFFGAVGGIFLDHHAANSGAVRPASDDRPANRALVDRLPEPVRMGPVGCERDR